MEKKGGDGFWQIDAVVEARALRFSDDSSLHPVSCLQATIEARRSITILLRRGQIEQEMKRLEEIEKQRQGLPVSMSGI